MRFWIIAGLLFLAACNSNEPADRVSYETISGKLIVFHAGSLSVPLRSISNAFIKEYPDVRIEMESAGSLASARKITDLDRKCDIMLSADHMIIDEMLIPQFAEWSIQFATNQMVIAYTPKSSFADQISNKNWYQILAKREVVFGRADPNSDPCGYRSILLFKLADEYYDLSISENLIKKDLEFIRPKSADLNALLQVQAIDYLIGYRSVAEQHGFDYLLLPDEINLGNPEFNKTYSLAKVSINADTPGRKTIIKGSVIVYGLTVLNDAPNADNAIEFIKYLLNRNEGIRILEDNGQPGLNPFTVKNRESLPTKLKIFMND